MMELQRRGNFLLVDTFNAKIVCDQCRSKHLRCDRAIPSCHRCLGLKINCTRQKAGYENKVIHGLSRVGWKLKSRTFPPSTWAQLIQTNTTPITRFYLWKYLMPLVLLLPKPSEAADIMQISHTAIQPPPYSFETKLPLQLEYPINETNNYFSLATQTFFNSFNVTYPLFSKETFSARPRSVTLIKLLIQIGLERMPQTDQVRAAMLSNNLTLSDFDHLPNSLDTLQCFLLAQYGARHSWLIKIRFRIFCTINRLITLLGLHNIPSFSPQWLECTLALHLTNLGEYGLSVSQSIAWTKFIFVTTTSKHLHPHFFLRMRNHFPHLSDYIHYITSQTSYYSFTIILNIHIHYTQSKGNAASFSKLLQSHVKALYRSFQWGYSNLSRLTSSTHQLLIRQSQLVLVFRHNNNYLELMKLASHIPDNHQSSLSPNSITSKVNHYSQSGVDTAIHTLTLASTLTTTPFDLDYILVQIPSLAFIMAYFKSIKGYPNYSHQLFRAIIQARISIAQGTSHPFHAVKARSYLVFIDYFLKKQNIHFAKPSATLNP
ncbi:hypothetical protein DSO57_1034769 [Entomophthora muscae]|uniref:Uncharacterized protein n=1 Tax=Entomophthora muscae TaxID=34485 RepID=A0ACC2TY67_9FUNG|nr:hypothetical protein DSO57_1034769 [Entomophthora muscae]